MGIFSDAISGFEECGRLIAVGKANESLYSLILIDSLIDIYSHQYARQKIHDKELSLSLRIHLGADHPDRIKIQQELSEINSTIKNFDNRFKWLVNVAIISDDMSKSIRHLHEYRNKYLHRLKERENDVIAFAKLYYYLYQQLFIAIPINCYSSTDSDESDIVRDLCAEHDYAFSTREFRQGLIDKVNQKYALSFSLQEHLDLLEQFLIGKYNDIIDSLHFLLSVAIDRNQAKKEIELQCNVGDIKITILDEEDDTMFTCTTTKTQEYLGKIRKIKHSQSEYSGLQLFAQLSESIDKFSQPLFELVFEVDSMIQYQVDVLRDK